MPVGLRSFAEQLRLSAAVRELDLDVALTPYFATSLWWPCPRVTIVQDLIPLTVDGSMPSWTARRVYELMLRATLARSQMVVVPSRATADDVNRLASRVQPRISVVPHAVDARFTPTSPSETDTVRSRYELGPSYVLTVAGDRPHKNLAGSDGGLGGTRSGRPGRDRSRHRRFAVTPSR